VKNIEEAEDVLQETFIQVFQKSGTYDQTKSRFFTWLAKIAINKSLDHIKCYRVRNQKHIISIASLPEDIFCKLQTSSVNIDTIGIKQLNAILSCSQRQVIDLLYYGGFTQAEAAEILHLPLGTIKSKVRLAICTFRKQF